MAANDLDALNVEIKKELSSLIISCPKGLYLKRLLHDYHDMIGRQVPYKKLGYGTFEQYLLSIPDTCRLIGSGDLAMVVPVVTEKNRHINEMILKQRPPSTKSKYRNPRRMKGVYNVNNSIPPRRAPPPQPLIPFKFPVNPNSHKIVCPPPPDYYLENRRRNVAPAPRNTYPQLNQVTNSCDNSLNTGTKPKQYVAQNLEPSTSRLQTNTDRKEYENWIYKADEMTSSKQEENMFHKHEPSPSCSQTNVEFVNNYRTSENNRRDSDEDSDNEFFLELGVSDDDDFCYKSDNEIDLTTSVRNMVVKNEQTSSFPSPVLELPIVEEPHISRVNNKTKGKLKQLIAEYPDGIWCSKLLRLFEEKFKQKLDPLNFGFTSVIEMCDDLPDVFYCIRPNRTDWKVFDKTKPVPDLHTIRDFSKYLLSLPLQDKRNNTEPALPENMMYIEPDYKYPDEVFNPGDSIERQWLVGDEKSGEYVELIISEVYDPSKFWVQLKGPSTSEALSTLMDDMQVFYMHNAKSFQMNDFSVRIGLLCAALFMNEYHRAVIIKIFDDQTIKVFYVDYGTVAQVQVRKTCFLHRDFGELPMQAVRARLANIIPIEQNTMWPRPASVLMLQLVMEKDLIAYIDKIDYEQEILSLIVTDTSQPDVDIHINDVLIEKGFAALGVEAPLCSSSNAIVASVHLYPAFEELEKGVYPSVSDVITMLKLGHTYETIFHGYFTTTADNSISFDYNDLQNSRSNSRLVQSVDKIEETYNSEPENLEIHEESPEEISPVELETKEENSSIEETAQEEPVITENIQPRSTLKPPPGFENVQPQKLDGNQFINMFRADPSIPAQPQIPVAQPVPVYPLSGVPLVKPNLIPNQIDPSMVSNLDPAYLLTNPFLYSHLYQAMMQQQRQEALFQAAQQAQFVSNYMQNLNMQKQQQFVQVNQPVNSYPQNYNIPNTPENAPPHMEFNNNGFHHTTDYYQSNNTLGLGVHKTSEMESSLPPSSLNPQQIYNPSQNCNDGFGNVEYVSNDFLVTTDLKEENKDSILNLSEHICDRCVLKLQADECSFHILKIEGEFYVVLQEIITSLLKTNLSWKNWLKSVNLNPDSIPHKLVNIMNYENVYKQIKRYSIPGVNPPNNFGCIVRLTSLEYVTQIVELFGNRNILQDLNAGIKHVMENEDIWKVKEFSD